MARTETSTMLRMLLIALCIMISNAEFDMSGESIYHGPNFGTSTVNIQYFKPWSSEWSNNNENNKGKTFRFCGDLVPTETKSFSFIVFPEFGALYNLSDYE